MTTRKFIPHLIIAILCLALINCSFNISTKPCNDKTLKKEVRTLDKFTGIDLSIAANIQLTQGTPQKFEIEGPACDLENTVTKVNGSVLTIENDHNITWGKRDKVTIYITVENIDKLSVAGSGDILAKNSLTTNDLRLDIAGSGSINIPDLKATTLKSSIAGSGSIEISGKDKAEKHKIHIAGSGDVKAKDFQTSQVEVSIAGSGSCYLNIIDRLKADIAGSGDIYYMGRPVIESSLAGSGKIKSLE
ncbi:MAG TPA: head GIN domain-containing protein [Bacteroidales bacterium]